MPCDRRLSKGQSISDRKAEIKESITQLSASLAAGRVRPVIGPRGEISFQGWTEQDRKRIDDACAYRTLLMSGSALALAAVARAEQMAGRSIDKQLVAAGAHSHDGGLTFHSHKG